MTQVAEIETNIAQSSTTPVQTTKAQKHNTKINKPPLSVPKVSNIETNKKPTTVRQTKISDLLGSSTSKTSTSYSHQVVESNSLINKQASGKRVASSPVNTETKKLSVEFHDPEDIWDDFDMDVDVLNTSTKVLNCASVFKNSKIQVKQDEWICSGIVMEGTKQEEVEFSSEVSNKKKI